jgi:hypothetical protein
VRGQGPAAGAAHGHVAWPCAGNGVVLPMIGSVHGDLTADFAAAVLRGVDVDVGPAGGHRA